MLKGRIIRGKKPFLNFVEKGSFFLKPENALVTTIGAVRYVLIVFGQTKGNNKRKIKHFCYKCGK